MSEKNRPIILILLGALLLGAKAPDNVTWALAKPLTVVDLEGAKTTLKPVPGRVSVLAFMGTGCVPCQRLVPTLTSLQRRFKDEDIDLFFIFAFDTLGDVKRFARAWQLPKAYLAERESLKSYHTPPLPTLFVVDRKGRIMKRFMRSYEPKKLVEILESFRWI